MDRMRADGTLKENITTAPFAYQASVDKPGYIERIDMKTGGKVIGSFKNREFVTLDAEDEMNDKINIRDTEWYKDMEKKMSKYLDNGAPPCPECGCKYTEIRGNIFYCIKCNANSD